jgi:hypothetical protein
MSECIGGTPPGPAIDLMIYRLVQRKILALNPDKPYSFRPSAKSIPTYDFRYQEREYGKLSAHDSELEGQRQDHPTVAAIIVKGTLLYSLGLNIAPRTCFTLLSLTSKIYDASNWGPLDVK